MLKTAKIDLKFRGVSGGWAGWAIAHPDFGVIEGAAGRRRHATTRHITTCPPSVWQPLTLLVNQKWMTSLTHIKSIHQNRKTSWQQTSSFFEYFNIHSCLPCLQKGLNYILRYSNCCIFEQANIYILMLCQKQSQEVGIRSRVGRN